MKSINLLLFLVLLSVINAYTVVGSTAHCNSCSDCTAALSNTSISKVILDNSIYGYSDSSACIQIGRSNVSFDCNGNIIEGTTQALSIIDSLNVSIHNCYFMDFDTAVNLQNSENLYISNVNATNISSKAFYIHNVEHSSFHHIKLDNVIIGFSVSNLNDSLLDSINISNYSGTDDIYGFRVFDSYGNIFKHITFSNTVTTHSVDVLYVENSENNVIDHMNVYNVGDSSSSTFRAIYYQAPTSHTSHNNSFMNVNISNITTGSSFYGIYMYYLNNTYVENLSISNVYANNIYALDISAYDIMPNMKVNNVLFENLYSNTYNMLIYGWKLNNVSISNVNASNITGRTTYFVESDYGSGNRFLNMHASDIKGTGSSSSFNGLVLFGDRDDYVDSLTIESIADFDSSMIVYLPRSSELRNINISNIHILSLRGIIGSGISDSSIINASLSNLSNETVLAISLNDARNISMNKISILNSHTFNSFIGISFDNVDKSSVNNFIFKDIGNNKSQLYVFTISNSDDNVFNNINVSSSYAKWFNGLYYSETTKNRITDVLFDNITTYLDGFGIYFHDKNNDSIISNIHFINSLAANTTIGASFDIIYLREDNNRTNISQVYINNITSIKGYVHSISIDESNDMTVVHDISISNISAGHNNAGIYMYNYNYNNTFYNINISNLYTWSFGTYGICVSDEYNFDNVFENISINNLSSAGVVYGVYAYEDFEGNVLNNINISGIHTPGNMADAYGIYMYSYTAGNTLSNIVIKDIYGWSVYGIYSEDISGYEYSNNTYLNITMYNFSSPTIILALLIGDNYSNVSNVHIENMRSDDVRCIYLNYGQNKIHNIYINNIESNTTYGIYLVGDNFHNVSDNEFSNIYMNGDINTTIGAYLYKATHNTFKDSRFINVSTFISISDDVLENYIFNNYVLSPSPLSVSSTLSGIAAFFNTSKHNGRNIIGGPYIGGNYWAMPNGSGFSEMCSDSNSDGICDDTYTIYTGTFDLVDYLPLAKYSQSSSGHHEIKYMDVYVDGNTTNTSLNIYVEHESMPVVSATVLIRHKGYIIVRDYTDSQGKVSFIPSDPGEYRITVKKSGYHTKEISINIYPSVYENGKNEFNESNETNESNEPAGEMNSGVGSESGHNNESTSINQSNNNQQSEFNESNEGKEEHGGTTVENEVEQAVHSNVGKNQSSGTNEAQNAAKQQTNNAIITAFIIAILIGIAAVMGGWYLLRSKEGR